MIIINVGTVNGLIRYVNLKGHAEYAEQGKDIICASVSSVTQYVIKAINNINSDYIKYTIEDEQISMINVLNEDPIIQILFKTFVDVLKEIQEQFPLNVKVIE